MAEKLRREELLRLADHRLEANKRAIAEAEKGSAETMAELDEWERDFKRMLREIREGKG